MVLRRLRILGAVELDDLAFDRLIRIGDDDMHQETVELRFGQRISALLLDRVLGREHHEQAGHLVGLAGDRDLAFLHGLQQRGLHLGGRAVDLVGQHEVGEDRTFLKLKLAALLRLHVDLRAGDIRRQQVRRELHARQIRRQMFCERLDRAGLGKARQALDQEIAVGQQGDQHALDQTILAEHRFSDP